MTDLEIDYMNKRRGISFTLSPEENLLYGYGSNITLEILEVMSKKFVATHKTGMI